jgi:GH25 family lysozyme M1 (1,4-beta-N-acetylmuramidase)
MTNILMKGFDVSASNTNVDFKKAKEQGYDFVIIRAGFGRYEKQKDTMFESHYKNAVAAGLHVGCYWYSYAQTKTSQGWTPEAEALEEAKVCAKIIAGKKFDMPIWYDLEENDLFNKGSDVVNTVATTFCNYMERNGYFCGLYGGEALTNLLPKNTLTRYALWYAQYLKEPRYKGTYGMWQYCVAGDSIGNNPNNIPCPSFTSPKLDMDYCYYDYPTAIKNKKLNGYGDNTPITPAPTPTPDPVTGFVPRLEKPEYGNKYYNLKENGGYAVGCIYGKPQQPGLNILSNCVGYAAARFNEIGDYKCWKYLLCPPNAENFIEKAQGEGLTISNKPSLGAIIVWQKGATLGPNDGAGHVAVVEVINDDGTIVTSESGYNCSNPFWTTPRNNKDGNWNGGNAYKFRGFVVNPAVVKPEPAPEPKPEPDVDPKNKCPYPEPTRYLKEGMTGEDVKWMQWYLNEYGLMFKEIDGNFDTQTLEALLTYQFKYKLQIDGCCGPATRQSLKTNLK